MQTNSISVPSRIYEPSDLAGYLKDYLDLYMLPRLAKSDSNSEFGIDIGDNQDFWLNLFEQKPFPGKRFRLKNFGLMEWLPASPGLYFTPRAHELRDRMLRQSESYLNTRPKNLIGKDFVELRPDEKAGMVRGGFGSVRLAPKKVNGSDYYFLCASHSLVSHEGIPVIVSKDAYELTINELLSDRIILVDAIGKLKVISDELSSSSIRYETGIPKYALEIEKIVPRGIARNSDGHISTAITFSRDLETYYSSSYLYSFCTFSPSKDDSSVKSAAAWLEDYAIRHSGAAKPLIIGDFDETVSYYPDVKLPLRDLMRGTLSPETLLMFKDMLHFTFTTGDVFNNISNSTIINNSHVSDFKNGPE